MKYLQLPLMTHWFNLTKSGVKTEEYREITPYWCKRLLTVTNGGLFNWDEYLKEPEAKQLLAVGIANDYFRFYDFSFNRMTLGYPRSTDSERILNLEHNGIEIRTGNPEWGAEPDRLYFVIKHGSVILT